RIFHPNSAASANEPMSAQRVGERMMARHRCLRGVTVAAVVAVIPVRTIRSPHPAHPSTGALVAHASGNCHIHFRSVAANHHQQSDGAVTPPCTVIHACACALPGGGKLFPPASTMYVCPSPLRWRETPAMLWPRSWNGDARRD